MWNLSLKKTGSTYSSTMGRSLIARMIRHAYMGTIRKSKASFHNVMNIKVLPTCRDWPGIILLFLVMMLSGGSHLFIRNPICLFVIIVYGARIYKLLGGITLKCVPRQIWYFLRHSYAWLHCKF